MNIAIQSKLNLTTNSFIVIRNFISCCLKKNPEARLTASQLLKHEYLDIAKVYIYYKIQLE